MLERVAKLAWSDSIDPKVRRRFEHQTASHAFKHIVTRFGLDSKSVLDLGCCYGEMVCQFGAGSIGITVNREEAATGSKLGLDIRYGNIEASSLGIPETFDFIYCGNLLEHLFAPHLFLMKIRSFLKPDGRLILGVPVLPKWVSLTRIPKFRGAFADAHINFYTADTFRFVVERAGWEIEEVRSFHFSPSWLDRVFRAVMPMMYIVAKPNRDFAYSEKRKKELAGYESDEYLKDVLG